MRLESSLSLYQCTVINMYGSHSTVTVCDWSPHCHYISAQLSICTVATVQLLYAIPVLTVTISVHTVTNLYGSHTLGLINLMFSFLNKHLLSSGTQEGKAEKSRKSYTSLEINHIRIIHELAAIVTYRYSKILLSPYCLCQEKTTHVL